MANDVSIKFKVDGEQQFKSAISGINAEIKSLDSEFKLAVTQMSKMADSEKSTASATEALTKKKQALTQKEEALTKKLESQQKAYQQIAKELEEAQKAGDSKKVDQLSNAYNNLAKACANTTADINKTKLELIECDDAIEDLTKDSNSAKGGLVSAGEGADSATGKFNNLGSAIKVGAVAMASFVASAGALAVSLGKQVVEAYSEFEQLKGGVETLFGDGVTYTMTLDEYAKSIGKTTDEAQEEFLELKQVLFDVSENSYNAFKTAGMSANEYMETVTSFSASLIQSLEGDTVQAVEYADMAIQDMSDNANKMGSDISTIQNAYSGFAKQNYTMLDNLKLGYGGTKTEMERLIADANELREAQGLNADLTIESYADVITAIHEIQNEMGVTGTTAKEAESTIQGSINMLQASWENLLSYLGEGTEDVYGVMDNLMDSLETVIGNITPVIENIIAYLPTLIEMLVETLVTMLPSLLETVSSLFSQVLESLIQLLPTIIPVVVEMVLTIINTLVENLPLLVECAMQIITAVVDGLTQAMPELIPAIVEAVLIMTETLLDNLPLFVESALKLGLGIITGLFKALPQIISEIPVLTAKILACLTKEFKAIITTAYTWGKDLLANFISGITAKISALKTKLSNVAQTVKDFLGFSEPKEGPLSNFHTYAPDMMKLYAQGMVDNINLIKSASTKVAENVGFGNGNGSASANGFSGNIVVQSVLDGRIIGESVYNYSNQRKMMYGV